MNRMLILVFACALCGPAISDDLILPNGKTFQNYKIKRTEPDGITIEYATGVAKIFFWDLTSEMQQKYNYDPLKARAYNKQVQAQQAAEWARQQDMGKRAQEKAKSEASSEIMLSIKNNERKALREKALAEAKLNETYPINAPIKVSGRIVRVTPKGALLKYVGGTMIVTNEMKKEMRSVDVPTVIFVLGLNWDNSSDFIGANYWEGIVWPAGTYTNRTIKEGTTIIPCYRLDDRYSRQ